MSKQTTAVEFLEKLWKQEIVFPYSFAMAKEMEKQQIIDAYYYDPNCNEIKDDGEQYYNQTFKPKQHE